MFDAVIHFIAIFREIWMIQDLLPVTLCFWRIFLRMWWKYPTTTFKILKDVDILCRDVQKSHIWPSLNGTWMRMSTFWRKYRLFWQSLDGTFNISLCEEKSDQRNWGEHFQCRGGLFIYYIFLGLKIVITPRNNHIDPQHHHTSSACPHHQICHWNQSFHPPPRSLPPSFARSSFARR